MYIPSHRVPAPAPLTQRLSTLSPAQREHYRQACTTAIPSTLTHTNTKEN